MSLDPGTLLLSLVTSGIGFVLFTYGRKQARLPQAIGGVLLMIYPYFASTLFWLAAGSVVIGGGVWLAVELGW